MNLTWHIVKKDCRRLRWPLAFWAALMIGQFVLGLMILRQVETEPEVLLRSLQLFDGLHVILWSLQVFFGFVLVAALIHEDPLVGQQTWWVTRPISGGRLLGAKLIALVLCFWVLPIVVTLPWWLYSGYDLREMISAAAQMTIGQAALTLFAFGLGVLTANYSRFIVVNLVIVFAWICCAMTVLAYGPRVPAGVGLTRFWLAIGAALVALGVISVHQFVTRRTGRSWAMVVGAFVLNLLVIRFAPGDWTDVFQWTGREPVELAPVTLKTGPVDFTDTGRTTAGDASQVMMRVAARYESAPAGYGFSGGRFTGTLQWSDGMKVERTGWLGTYLGPIAWRLMGIQDVPNLESGRTQVLGRAPGIVAMTSLPRSLVAKVRDEAPAWDARFELWALRGELVAEVPFKPGAQGGWSGHRINLLEIEHEKGGSLTMTAAESEPVLAFDLLPGFYSMSFGRAPGLPNMFYALCSRDRSKVLFLTENRILYTQVATVALERRSFSFTAEQLAYPAQPNWLDDAVLMKVAFRRVGTAIRSVHSDGLTESEFSRTKAASPVTRSKASGKP